MAFIVHLLNLVLANTLPMENCDPAKITLVVAPTVGHAGLMAGLNPRMETLEKLGPDYQREANTIGYDIAWLGDRAPVKIAVFWSKDVYVKCEHKIRLGGKPNWLSGLGMVIDDLITGRQWRYDPIPARPSHHERCGNTNIDVLGYPTSVGWIDVNELVGGMEKNHVYRISIIAHDDYLDGIEPKPAQLKTMTSYLMIREPKNAEERAMRYCRMGSNSDDELEVPDKKCFSRKDPDAIKVIEKLMFMALEESPGLLCAVNSLAGIYASNRRYRDAFKVFSYWYPYISKKHPYAMPEILEKMTAFWLYEGLTIVDYYQGWSDWKEYMRSVLDDRP